MRPPADLPGLPPASSISLGSPRSPPDLPRQRRFVSALLSREPLEALRVEALADRADYEVWRCESASWHTDPDWFARRALTRVAAYPDGGDGRAFLAYAQCLTSVDTLFDAARRSIVEAHPASLGIIFALLPSCSSCFRFRRLS